jgi:hypothetical protein
MEQKPIPPNVREVLNIDSFAEREAARKRMHAKSVETQRINREKKKRDAAEAAEKAKAEQLDREEAFAHIEAERVARLPISRDIVVDGEVQINPDYLEAGEE